MLQVARVGWIGFPIQHELYELCLRSWRWFWRWPAPCMPKLMPRELKREMSSSRSIHFAFPTRDNPITMAALDLFVAPAEQRSSGEPTASRLDTLISIRGKGKPTKLVLIRRQRQTFRS